MSQLKRRSAIRKINYWLKKNGMTLKDYDVDVPLKNATDELIQSILEDIEEDKAREEYDEYLSQESFNDGLDEDNE